MKIRSLGAAWFECWPILWEGNLNCGGGKLWADLISAQMTLLPSAFNLPVASQDGGKPIAPGIVWEEVLQAH